MTPNKIRITLNFARPGEWMTVALPSGTAAATVTGAAGSAYKPVRCTSEADLATARRTAYWSGRNGVVVKLVSSAANLSPAVMVAASARTSAITRA